jgi:hypothetical protein
MLGGPDGIDASKLKLLAIPWRAMLEINFCTWHLLGPRRGFKSPRSNQPTKKPHKDMFLGSPRKRSGDFVGKSKNNARPN